MSLFKVAIQEIESVRKHPNADKLDIVKMKGLDWQCITRRGGFKAGDFAIYFPVDSVMPDTVLNNMGLINKLSGPNKNRVKTIKLRGEISQGLVACPFELFLPAEADKLMVPGLDLTEKLGIVKYEPPEILCKNAWLNPLPDGVSVYDIESAGNYPQVVEKLMDMEVLITEKLEGTNFSATLDENDKFWVNQRKHTIVPRDGEEHTFWKVANDLKLLDALKWMKAQGSKNVTIRGELVGPGIQGNIYNLGKPQLFVFDIVENYSYIRGWGFLSTITYLGLTPCPILSSDKTLREWLGGSSIQGASNGKSQLFDTLREGIVIRPIDNEFEDLDLGRVIIKQRSPEYLAKTDF